MEGAKGVLFNVTGGEDLTLMVVAEASDIIATSADRDANVIFGAVVDPTLNGEVRITLIATGFDGRAVAVKTTATSSVVGTPKLRELPVPIILQSDDLEIPAFLRNRR